jgi:hypothetical protein
VALGLAAQAVEGAIKGFGPKMHRHLIFAACITVIVVAWHALDVAGWVAGNISFARVGKDGSLEIEFRATAPPK